MGGSERHGGTDGGGARSSAASGGGGAETGTAAIMTARLAPRLEAARQRVQQAGDRHDEVLLHDRPFRFLDSLRFRQRLPVDCVLVVLQCLGAPPRSPLRRCPIPPLNVC